MLPPAKESLSVVYPQTIISDTFRCEIVPAGLKQSMCSSPHRVNWQPTINVYGKVVGLVACDTAHVLLHGTMYSTGIPGNEYSTQSNLLRFGGITRNRG